MSCVSSAAEAGVLAAAMLAAHSRHEGLLLHSEEGDKASELSQGAAATACCAAVHLLPAAQQLLLQLPGESLEGLKDSLYSAMTRESVKLHLLLQVPPPIACICRSQYAEVLVQLVVQII